MVELTVSSDNKQQLLYQLFGIKNCDTMKKARRWLDDHNVSYHFHDYRQDGIDSLLLQRFLDHLGWQMLLNTKSTTWRGLDEKLRNSINDTASAKALMLMHPTLIKRPVLANGERFLVGFKPDSYQDFITGTA